MNNLSISITILALLLVAPLFNNAQAQQIACPERGIQQYTDDTSRDSEEPSIDALGNRIAFRSSANLTGENPTPTIQIFYVDTLTGDITQVTNGTGTNNSTSPSINASGMYIAFDSRANINNGNPQNISQIILFNIATGTFTQITNNSDMNDSTESPSISGDGNIIAFESDADINGGNPDGNNEIYFANVGAGTIIQVTDTTGGGSNNSPDISEDGRFIAFISDRNLTGGNPLMIEQLFLFNIAASTITQITNNTSGEIGSPSINRDGSLIAFTSTPLAIFNMFLAHTSPIMIEQLTDATSGGVSDLSISSDGSVIAFESRANINGGNPDGNREIYLYDIATGIFIQITDEPAGGPDDSEDPSVNADGTRIAFRSEANINGGNPQGRRQIFMATCIDPMNARNIPTLSEWGLIAMAGVLGIIGLIAIHRRKATI